MSAAGSHDLSGGGAVLERVTDLARAAAAGWGRPAAVVSLLNVSENATFLVEDPDVGRSVLRVSRLGYHPPRAVASELAWTDALRREAGVSTPRALPDRAGRLVVQLDDPAAGAPRTCVMFEHVPGAEPDPTDADGFEALGELTARLHAHARSWRPPAWFTRFAWDLDAAFGPAPRWGHWRQAPGVGTEEARVLGRLEQVVTTRLVAYGTGPERFGLIHADTRPANLLVDAARAVRVIDFDDCGMGWFLYDLGTACSFFEHEAHVPELVDRWLTGYRRVGNLTAADEGEIWTFLLLRRLLLVAWLGSHPVVDLARTLGGGYAAGSCELAERYLAQYG